MRRLYIDFDDYDDDDEYVFNALKYGASGYLLKGISMSELSEAVHKVYQGYRILPSTNIRGVRLR